VPPRSVDREKWERKRCRAGDTGNTPTMIQTSLGKLHTWEATMKHQQLEVDGPYATLHC
jgi:hypothetical protein